MKRLGLFFLLASLSVFGAIGAAVSHRKALPVAAPQQQKRVAVTLYSAPKPAPKVEKKPEAKPVVTKKVLSKPKPKPKPKPKKRPEPPKKPEPNPRDPEPQAVAEPEPVAAPEPDAQAASTAAAKAETPPEPAAAAGGALQRPIDAYYAKLYRRISRYKGYPAPAKRFGIEGEVTVAFRIDGEGKIVETALQKGSGSRILDRAAREIFKRIGRFEKPPVGMDERRFEIIIEYYLTRR